MKLDRIFLWLNSNKLSLNVKKTQFMVFSLKKHITANTDMCINNQIIYRVEHITFLGVILDSHLTWSYHIQHVKLKIAKSIGILCRARKVACRIITSMPPKTSSVYLFTVLNLLSFNAIYTHCVLVMMYKWSTGVLPGALSSMFSRTKSVHSIATRQTDKLHVHLCNLQVTSKVIRYSGVSLWNN